MTSCVILDPLLLTYLRRRNNKKRDGGNGLLAYQELRKLSHCLECRPAFKKETLDQLIGSPGSRSARIGSGACAQYRLDICSELLDSAYLLNKNGAPVSYKLRLSLRALVSRETPRQSPDHVPHFVLDTERF